MSVPDGVNFWLMAASLLTGVMRQDHRAIDVAWTDYRQLADELVQRLK